MHVHVCTVCIIICMYVHTGSFAEDHKTMKINVQVHVVTLSSLRSIDGPAVLTS